MSVSTLGSQRSVDEYSLDEDRKQTSPPPRRLLEHLNVSWLLLLVELDLSHDLGELGVGVRIRGIVRVAVNLLEDFPGFGSPAFEAEVAGGF